VLGGCAAWLLHGATGGDGGADASSDDGGASRMRAGGDDLYEWKVEPAAHLLLQVKLRALRMRATTRAGGRLDFLGLNRKTEVRNRNRNGWCCIL